jgi:hypothetical protein
MYTSALRGKCVRVGEEGEEGTGGSSANRASPSPMTILNMIIIITKRMMKITIITNVVHHVV